MKQTLLNCVGAGSLCLLVLSHSSCSSDKPPEPKAEGTSMTKVEPGVPGGIVVETRTVTANVVHINGPAREVLLATPDGKRERIKCGPEVRNFDQIRVGDQLKVTLAEELAVYMSTEAAPPDAAAAALVALAPKGEKPGGIMASTVQVTATVVAIDVERHRARLLFPDGTLREVAVRRDIDLTKRRVGENVAIRMTEAMAITVEKPAPAGTGN